MLGRGARVKSCWKLLFLIDTFKPETVYIEERETPYMFGSFKPRIFWFRTDHNEKIHFTIKKHTEYMTMIKLIKSKGIKTENI